MKRATDLFGITLAVALLTATGLVLASDMAKEKRWADQIVDALIDGEAEWLKADGHEFLAIYTEAASGETGRAVILLHGIGVHPDWPQVIHPLRVGLVEHGWSTLSLQLPVLAGDAKGADYAPLFDAVAPRIDAGVAFLAEQGAKEIVLVGHSLGAAMAAYYLSTGERPIAALVGIGMIAGASDPRMDNARLLEKIHIPTLDLYGSEDIDRVKGTAAQRVRAARGAGNEGYRQVKVAGADHFFDGKEPELVDTVSRWLKEAP